MARAILQFIRNHDAASLDGADKAAIDFDNLPGSARSKRQLSKWHSDFRFIAERWQRPVTADDSFVCVSDEQRDGIIAGTISFLTVADNLRKQMAKAKAEATKAAKAEADKIAAAAVVAENSDDVPVTVVETLAAAFDMLADADLADCAAAAELVALIADRIALRQAELTADQPQAVAA
jgi:hypothetical protein